MAWIDKEEVATMKTAALIAALILPALGHAQSPAPGTITTVAGSRGVGSTGDGGPATSARLFSPAGVAVDSAGNLFILEGGAEKIRKVTPAGIISTVAGNGSRGFSGDGGPATSATFSFASGHHGIAVDREGNLYIPDQSNQRVRKVDGSGVITTVAGNGSRVFSGDGGPATSAGLVDPSGVALDSAGNLYIANSAGNRVRVVNPAGIITTFAGGGPLGSGNGDGGPATRAVLNAPVALAVDGAGNVYIADATARRVRVVNAAGIITTVAGNGGNNSSGDGGPATSASFNPNGIAVDSAGRLYIAEASNRVRQVSTTGIITTFAGTGAGGFSGDGGPASSATLSDPNAVALDSAGNLYISDRINGLIRKVISGAPQPAAPVVTSVVNGASFEPGIVANSWATVQGSNLAAVTDTWANSIVDGKLPTTLGGVTVFVGGKPAYLYYVSPTQINLIAPDSAVSGTTPVVVTNAAASSQAFPVAAREYGPAFFTWPGNQVVATRQDFSLAVKDGTFASPTVAARPGDVLILWGTGFGPTNPAAPTGVQVPADRTYATVVPPSVTVNNLRATVFGAALAPGFAGLYQVAIQVPASLPDGDWPLVAVAGPAAPATVLSVRR